MKHSTLTRSLCFILFAILPCLRVQAAVAPDAGGLMQQATPAPATFSFNEDAGLRIQQPDGSKLPDSLPFLVNRIEISGQTLLPLQTLHALVADAEGKKLSLSELSLLAQRLTDAYRAQGYPLARAIIPAQTIQAGVVSLVILEGRFGAVSLNNSSRVKSSVLRSLLAPLQSGKVISQRDLDRSLLLLADISGVEINATLKPGSTVGSADLDVSTLLLPALTGSLALDNFGNRYTGQNRANLALSYSNPLRSGDSLSMNLLSTDGGMLYGRLAYEILLNGHGSRAGISYSNLRYTLGDVLASLDANGSAQNQSLWIRHPLLRSQNNTIFAQLQYDGLRLQDRIDSSALQNRRTLHSLSVSLTGNLRDALLGEGQTNWSASMTAGQVSFGDANAQLSDAASAKTQGGFAKWNASLMRLQTISAKNSLFLSLSGQAARSNLDSSQKMTIGGPYNVRAYAVGSAAADSAVLVSAEIRHQLGWFAQGQLTATAFFDSAYLITNAAPWVAGNNHARLTGAGLGLNWAHPQRWTVRSFVARPLWPVDTDKPLSARVWITLDKGF